MRYWLILLSCIFPLLLSAQLKHDNIWLLGYHPEPGFPDPILGGTMINFNEAPPDTSRFDIPIRFNAIAMISDSNGQLLFYTNACQIINRNHVLMENGDSINPGLYHDDYCAGGYPLYQGVIILPLPEKPGMYILFHIKKQDTGTLRELLYSVIDMNTPDNLGKVVEKNQVLLVGDLADMMTVVRHGNGRDWWVVLPKDASNHYYLFMVTPGGVTGPETKQSGVAWNYKDWAGQSVFSPDGSKYARVNPFNGLHLFRFDRCSGEFSAPLKITFPDDTISSSGAAFSPNSRYLYVSASKKVYQFDTEAANVAASKQTVAVYDGYESPFGTRFFQQMLGPDGKIYITTPSSNNVLHVIHQPDEAGAACDFEQHGLILPTLHAFMAPNFPHFRLYDKPGSPCDTLGIDAPTVAAPEPPADKRAGLQVAPNPAAWEVTLSYPGDITGTWRITAASGQVLRSGNWSGTQTLVRVHDLASGVYFATLIPDKGQPVVTKFLLVR